MALGMGRRFTAVTRVVPRIFLLRGAKDCVLFAFMHNPIRTALETARTWMRATRLTEREIAARSDLSVRTVSYLKRQGHDARVSTLARIFDVMAEDTGNQNTAATQSFAQGEKSASRTVVSETPRLESTL